jgi:hypothetical protein
MRRLLISCLLVLSLSSAASAAGINLYWNGCSQDVRTNLAFACQDNSGVSTLVASFDPPYGITKLVGGTATIDFLSASSIRPPWWRLEPGGCRDGALSLSFDPPAAASGYCESYWPSATGNVSFQTSDDPSYVRMVVSWSIPEALAGPVQPGWEYYAFQLTIDHSKTVGSGACAGCSDPACLVILQMTLHQASGLGDFCIGNPLTYPYATWQGGAIGGYGCPGTDGPGYPYPPVSCVTPVLGHTWGRVKQIYR